MTMKRFLLVLSILLAVAASANAQGLPIKSGAATDLATVDTSKNLRTSTGASTRRTYTVNMGAQATTAAMTLSIEAGAGVGFKLARYCVSTSVATGAAKVDVVVSRRTTAASSGGTQCTADGTTVGGCAVSRMDTSLAAFTGIARNGGTPGTQGATIEQHGWTVGELGAGAADPASQPVQCFPSGADNGMQLLTVPLGVTNGLTITVSAAGAGGLASGAITAWIIEE
jgi:hypothetical protein